jgi:hypothetical protein
MASFLPGPSKTISGVSHPIKEMEGLLNEEDEEFIIGRLSGYGISKRSSTGLEANNVALWLMKTFAVFFVPQKMTEQWVT